MNIMEIERNKIKDEKSYFEIIKLAKINISKSISSNAINKDKINSISPLDACTCTGNCENRLTRV